MLFVITKQMMNETNDEPISVFNYWYHCCKEVLESKDLLLTDSFINLSKY